MLFLGPLPVLTQTSQKRVEWNWTPSGPDSDWNEIELNTLSQHSVMTILYTLQNRIFKINK